MTVRSVSHALYLLLRNASIDLNLEVKSQETEPDARPVRRRIRLCAGLRFSGPVHAADARLLYRDRLHHALSLGASCRSAVPEAQQAAVAVARDPDHHRRAL